MTEIRKATGETEEFDRAKLEESLERAGVRSDMISKVTRGVEKRAKRLPSTDHVFNVVRQNLDVMDPIASMRYGLKRALLKLGPSGHPFEYYFAKVLEAHGYDTIVGAIVDGHCVPHEIDVIATKKDQRLMIESKFHTRHGIRSSIKDALYVHSRYLDVRDKEFDKSCFFEQNPSSTEDLDSSTARVSHDLTFNGNQQPTAERGFTKGALVTNTKVSHDARLYSQCSGLQVISWRYPREKSLERLIESQRVYPVTVFSSLSSKQFQSLFHHSVYTVMDLVESHPNQVAQILRLNRSRVSAMQTAGAQLLGLTL